MNKYEKCEQHALQHAWRTGRPRACVNEAIIMRESQRAMECFFLMDSGTWRDGYGLKVSLKGVMKEYSLDEAVALCEEIYKELELEHDPSPTPTPTAPELQSQ